MASDAVSVIPTSLQRLRFVADQVTLERTGVEVTGMAVYRIADLLTAYRVLNFSFPERAQEKLEETLTGMLVGATRRLVANLTVDDCLQKRKAALADELLVEVAPVLGGRGRLEDATDQGWGVVLDTVEIEEVRISSQQVFAEMQAPYRSQLAKRAAYARADAEREAALQAAENKRLIEAARYDAERVVAEAESEVKRRRLAIALEESEVESESKRRRYAIGQRFGEVKITQIGGSDQSPFGSIAQALAGVLELARQG